MLVSTAMLMFIAVLFSILSFSPVMAIAKTELRPHSTFHIRAAFVGTIDDLYQAVIVFGLSVLVSSFIYRSSTDSQFDVLMADGLSMLCSTTVIMLTPTYWDFNERRPQWAATVLAVVIMTVVMFGTHFHVIDIHASPAELACGSASSKWTSGNGDDDPFDIAHFRFVPVGFTLWCLVLIGSMLHQPIVRTFRPKKMSVVWWIWVVVESFPSTIGFFALFVYAAYFYNTWHMMKSAYGNAFTKPQEAWGFGQLLSLFTWLPPIFTFVHLFFSKF
jgi:hypothetical protein